MKLEQLREVAHLVQRCALRVKPPQLAARLQDLCQLMCEVVLAAGAAVRLHRGAHSQGRDGEHSEDKPLRARVARVEAQAPRVLVRDPPQDLPGALGRDHHLPLQRLGQLHEVVTLDAPLELGLDAHGLVHLNVGLRVPAAPLFAPVLHALVVNHLACVLRGGQVHDLAQALLRVGDTHRGPEARVGLVDQ